MAYNVEVRLVFTVDTVLQVEAVNQYINAIADGNVLITEKSIRTPGLFSDVQLGADVPAAIADQWIEAGAKPFNPDNNTDDDEFGTTSDPIITPTDTQS